VSGRCLVVANQTLGGVALDQAVEDAIARGLTRFHVVVPMTPVEYESTSWTGGFGFEEYAWLSGETRAALEAEVEEDLRRQEQALTEARLRSRQRLELMLQRIADLGGDATGEVGPEDPIEATQLALEGHAAFDEIIVSTLPSKLSRWLRMAAPDRIARMTDVPVVTVEATE
jgi:hypothetical protein